MTNKTPEQIVESIPEEDRGHVFHLLGKALGQHSGGVHTADSGDNYPKPKKPPRDDDPTP